MENCKWLYLITFTYSPDIEDVCEAKSWKEALNIIDNEYGSDEIIGVNIRMIGGYRNNYL